MRWRECLFNEHDIIITVISGISAETVDCTFPRSDHIPSNSNRSHLVDVALKLQNVRHDVDTGLVCGQRSENADVSIHGNERPRGHAESWMI